MSLKTKLESMKRRSVALGKAIAENQEVNKLLRHKSRTVRHSGLVQTAIKRINYFRDKKSELDGAIAFLDNQVSARFYERFGIND